MKEIIPIKKDLLLKTKVSQITNIDLEHNYKINDNLVEGNIILNGSYKMTEASVLEDEFNYNIPFKVSISKKVNKDTIKIEIDDFKYEVNKDVLNVEVDLLFSCDELVNENYELDNQIEINKTNIEENNETIEQENEIDENDILVNQEKEININENINNITNIINNENKYYTYRIYNAKEGDTIESICLKYNINENEFKEYNNINEIHEGDKIIIPSSNE